MSPEEMKKVSSVILNALKKKEMKREECVYSLLIAIMSLIETKEELDKFLLVLPVTWQVMQMEKKQKTEGVSIDELINFMKSVKDIDDRLTFEI